MGRKPQEDISHRSVLSRGAGLNGEERVRLEVTRVGVRHPWLEATRTTNNKEEGLALKLGIPDKGSWISRGPQEEGPRRPGWARRPPEPD